VIVDEARTDRRTAWWFAGCALFVFIAVVLAGFDSSFQVQVSGGGTVDYIGGVLLIPTLAAVYCAYRLGKLDAR
jgi:ABC-type antimicrobial peptide transport system permease subunit